MKTANQILLCLIASLMIGGCISSNRPTASYLLRPDDSAPRQYANVVAIDSVQLAGYQERPHPVVRSGRHRVDFNPFMVWAQDFRSMIKETLAGNILLRNSNAPNAKVFHAIVHFMRFEVDENSGKLVVNAVCMMRCERDSLKKQVVLEYDCVGCKDERLIDLYDKALSELADKLCEMAE